VSHGKRREIVVKSDSPGGSAQRPVDARRLQALVGRYASRCRDPMRIGMSDWNSLRIRSVLTEFPATNFDVNDIGPIL
jgi:hypothetical protein